MSKTANRAFLRRCRQAARRAELTPEEFKANPQACENYIIFGGDFAKDIITMASRRISGRSMRAYRKGQRAAQDRKKAIEAYRAKEKEQEKRSSKSSAGLLLASIFALTGGTGLLNFKRRAERKGIV